MRQAQGRKYSYCYLFHNRQLLNFLKFSSQQTLWKSVADPQRCCKKGVINNFAKFTGKPLYRRPFFNKVAGLNMQLYLKKASLQVFSCEFCEIFKSDYLGKHLWKKVSWKKNSFKYLRELWLWTSERGVFTILSNIYDGTFFRKDSFISC